MVFKFDVEFKNLPKEGPPPTSIPFNPSISFMTALSNYCIANGKRLDMRYNRTGEPHMPMWTSTCMVDEKAYGTAHGFNKKAADKEAARQTLDMLAREEQHLSSSRKYHPIFIDYLERHGLKDRVEFESTSDGLAHSLTWSCVVFLDGVEIGQGVHSTKKSAIEKAAISAASQWPWSKLS